MKAKRIMDTIKYEDLKCEFCNGGGEKEKFVEPYGDSPITCTFCNGTGIDHDQLQKLFYEQYSVTQDAECVNCHCSFGVHRDDRTCPDYGFGKFNGWLDSKFSL